MRTPPYYPRNYSYHEGTNNLVYGTKNSFKGRTLETSSEYPVVFVVDGTGSMGYKWVHATLKEIGHLENELENYLPDFEMSVTVVGDAYSDYSPMQPLQVSDFGRGKVLKNFLKSFKGRDHTIGGGGGQTRETYELAALIYSDKKLCKMPNAKQPFFFIVGDEGYYDHVERNHVKALVSERVPRNLRTVSIFNKLKKKFDDNVCIFRKKYEFNDFDERRIQDDWEKLLGYDQVNLIDHPYLIKNAAIEPLKGIVAKSMGMARDYLSGLRDRSDAATTQYMADFLGVKLETLEDDIDPFGWVQEGNYSY